MDMSISEAKAHLTELVRRAEAGEEIILTRHGRPVARLVGERASKRRTAAEVDAVIRKVQEDVAAKGLAWPNQTSSHDDLYDDLGLPK